MDPKPDLDQDLNDQKILEKVSNTHDLFRAISDVVNVPEYTENQTVAQTWIEDGNVVVSENGGLFYTIESVCQLLTNRNKPLYSKYIPKKDEYRVTIFDREVKETEIKVRSGGLNYPNLIRNSIYGWSWSPTSETDVPEDVIFQAMKTISTLGLHFGMVKLLWNPRKEKAFVYGIDTVKEKQQVKKGKPRANKYSTLEWHLATPSQPQPNVIIDEVAEMDVETYHQMLVSPEPETSNPS